MHGLQLPNRPSQPLPPLESSTSSSSSPPHQHPLANHSRPNPPPNFSLARSQARLKRQHNKSPFVPKKTQQSTTSSSSSGGGGATSVSSSLHPNGNGKERDLTTCSIEQLQDMLIKNQRLLDSPETFVNLPGGDSRLRSQQNRILVRLKELEDVQFIKRELDSTHIDNNNTINGSVSDAKGNGGRTMVGRRRSSNWVKVEDGVEEEEDVKLGESNGSERMEDVVENGILSEASSPGAKRRIAAQFDAQNPHLMSLSESISLQRRAVERDRIALERRQHRMELDSKRPEKVGGLLKGAMAGRDTTLGEFMFAGDQDDSDEELDESSIDDWLNAGRKGLNGELNDEENEQLNPLKTAYMEGWNRALAEEEEAGGGARSVG